MISLQDQIKKFQNQIYSKELEEFILIDDQFLGSGITMQSLIKENAFITEEIRKMKGVFQNYCKLNQNVYAKITEHELALHQQRNKINALTSSADRHLNETIRQVKEIYQQVLYNQQRTKKTMIEQIKPIQEQLKQKVDQSSFSRQMKRILQELQQEGGADDGGAIQVHPNNSSSTQLKTSNQASQLGGNGFKKKGKKAVVQLEQFNAEKEKINMTLTQISKHLQSINQKTQAHDVLLAKQISKTNYLQQSYAVQQEQIFKLKKDSQENKRNMSLLDDRLMKQITNRTSDSVWQNKLGYFLEKSIEPKMNIVTKSINRLQAQTNKSFDQLEPRFSNLMNKISAQDEFAKGYTIEIDKLKEQLSQVQYNMSQNQKRFSKQNQICSHRIEEVSTSLAIKIQKQQVKNVANFEEINSKVQNLSLQIVDTVLKGVTKKISAQIKAIQSAIHGSNVKQSEISAVLYRQNGQIYNIKEVLGKKANFSDILLHFERKADKADIVQLSQKLDTAPSFFKSTILDSVERTKRRPLSSNQSSPSQLRKKSSYRGIRNHSKSPIIVSPNIEEDSISQSQTKSKIFACGLQKDFPILNSARRLSYTESSKRKKLRSSFVKAFNV